MSRRSIKSNISSKFANSPYLNSVQPRQSCSSAQIKERGGKKNRDEEQHEEQHMTETVVSERPRRSTSRRGQRRSGSTNSVKSNITFRSTKTRSSSPIRISSRIGRPRIDILLPSEVERLLISFSSKYKNEDHPIFVVGGNYIAAQDDELTIATASNFDDNLVYKECEGEIFSSDLFAHILARDPDQV